MASHSGVEEILQSKLKPIWDNVKNEDNKVPAEEKVIDDRKNIIKTTKKRKKKKPLPMGISAEEIESLTVKIPFMAKK